MPELPSTLQACLAATVAARGGETAVRTLDDATSWTWSELDGRARDVARGLAADGVRAGDRVALVLDVRPEFFACDLGAVLLGAVPVSLYVTSAAEQLVGIVKDAEARVVITESAHLDRVRRVQAAGAPIERIVVVDGPAPRDGLTLDELVAAGHDHDLDLDRAALADPEDLLTIIYTSGTTGPPKGVELTHRNLLAAMRSIGAVAGVEAGDEVISWLPMAHIAERNASYYGAVLFGLRVTTCPDAKLVGQYLAGVRPRWFFAVPRVWEKLKAGIEAAVGGMPDAQREALEGAIGRGLERVWARQRGEAVREGAEADLEALAPLRAKVGLDRLRTANIGAAPSPPSVIAFFRAIGVPLGEIWGLSECCACATCTPRDEVRIGSAGPAVPGVEVRLDDDGEVLVRGEVVMRGYRGMPEATAETVHDGWLRTGDIGRLDEDGWLWIVDRKKELIISAGGKNMSPASIETALKAAHPLIGQAVAVGDGRPYNVALVVLDPDAAPAWAARQGIEGDLAALAGHPAIREEVVRGVREANGGLGRVEQIKRVAVLPEDWAPGGDELTPTMKLKRRPIAEKHAAVIEALYDGGDGVLEVEARS